MRHRRRSSAKLCRAAGGELEQIQLEIPDLVVPKRRSMTLDTFARQHLSADRSEQSKVSKSLLNRRDLFCWARILVGRCSGRREAEQFFAMHNPGALRHETVLARNPFFDLLVSGAWPS